MTVVRNALTLIVLYAATCAPALAGPDGLRATAIAGLERTDSAPGAGAQNGVYYGVQIGADWSLGGAFAGVEGEIGESTARDLSLPGQPRQAEFGNLAVRLGVPVTGGTRAFVRGGYAYHRIDNAVGADFNGHGYVIGGGVEADLAANLFARAEYRYSDYGSTVRGQQFLGGIGVRF